MCSQLDDISRRKIAFEVTGDYALFSDPITRVGGEKCSYPIPTYGALVGIAESIYWKPTFNIVVDRMRVMNQIRTESKGARTLKPSGGNDISIYNYLKDVRYLVEIHLEWNMNRPDLANDRNANKHYEMMRKAIRKGGRRDIFLGTRECQADVQPCTFNDLEDPGFYGTGDHNSIGFGLMYYGITYPDSAYSEETKDRMTIHFWSPVMKDGVVEFPRPEDCPVHKDAGESSATIFIPGKNFSYV